MPESDPLSAPGLLTEYELDTLNVLAQLADRMRKVIIGTGSPAHIEGDWAEAAAHIHALQQMVMSQAAARAYPDRFRLLGGPER